LYGKVRKEIGILPRKGYKCITVTEKIHKDIKKRAEETNRNIREYVEYLLAKDKMSKEGK
jgi:hypothetical protein